MYVNVRVSEAEIAKTCRNNPDMLGRLLVEIAAAIRTGQSTPEGREAWAFAVMESIAEDYAKDDLEAVTKMIGLLGNAAMLETGPV